MDVVAAGLERTGAGSAAMDVGAVVVGVDMGEDMIDPGTSDTKLVEPASLPGLGRRLYGWKGGWRGAGRRRRRVGAVVARERSKGGG